MRTRSQAKREKPGQKRKIPQLNEDVLEIILNHVIKKQKKHALDTVTIIDDHFDLDGYMLSEFNRYSREIKWPDYLDTNMRRIIHHTSVKLFPYCELRFPNIIENHVKTKRDLDLLWRTIKHFDSIRFWDNENKCFTFQTSRVFIRKLWERAQAPTSLMKLLEKRLL